MRFRFLLLLLPGGSALAQDTLQPQPLQEITVRAYERSAGLMHTPAAISTADTAFLQQFGNASLVNAVNALPGARMEERAPGSYRLNIRGSSMRSPFGVRNVKVYYNDIPFTDAGGNTYLNQLGWYNINGLELIKGPGSSVYGAGTGGVLLLQSLPADRRPGVRTEWTAGSCGLLQAMAELRQGDSAAYSVIRYQHLVSDGYREHSALRRDVLSWDMTARAGHAAKLEAHALYGDLAYETPGALTFSEYDRDPRMARPATGAAPGAAAVNARIRQQMLLAGFSIQQRISAHWDYRLTLYGMYVGLRNPAIRNDARTTGPTAGGRSVLQYTADPFGIHLEWLAGAELLQQSSAVQTYSNMAGALPDTLQSDERTGSRNLLAFTQLTLQWRGWVLTAGAGLSALRFRYSRLPSEHGTEVLDFNNQLSPRIALLKRWSTALSAYAAVSRGFSPPAGTELSPSGGSLNRSLQAEQGYNYELGGRGYLPGGRLYYDASLFLFRLANAIVQRRDAAGGDYYLNSGGTDQRGAEVLLRYGSRPDRPLHLNVWTSYTLHRFRYRDFRQPGDDYSGNALPGVPLHTVAAGLTVGIPAAGLSCSLNYSRSAGFPLNDANTDLNAAYQNWSFRAGWDRAVGRAIGISLFAGGDNLLDARYSAAPDINAFGGRYYNAAPGRSVYAGLSLRRQ